MEPSSQKIRKYLKNPGASSWFYGIYRTKDIGSCLSNKSFIGIEFVTSINLLKIGDFYELDEILLHRFDSGWSTYGLIKIAKMANNSLFGILFPYYPFMSWCKKNLGLKNIFSKSRYFFKNEFKYNFFSFC